MSLEINIFGFKNGGEKWSGIYFEIQRAPSEIPASPNGQMFWHWAAATLKWLSEFQNKKNLGQFSPSFKAKNENFKTRDFRMSPIWCEWP